MREWLVVLAAIVGCSSSGSGGGTTADAAPGDSVSVDTSATSTEVDPGGDDASTAESSTESSVGPACSAQGSCANTGGPQCSEFGNYDSAGLDKVKADCAAAEKVWSPGPCKRDGALGGCRVVNAIGKTCDVAWFYKAAGVPSEAVLKGSCEGGGGVWIKP